MTLSYKCMRPSATSGTRAYTPAYTALKSLRLPPPSYLHLYPMQCLREQVSVWVFECASVGQVYLSCYLNIHMRMRERERAREREKDK